MGEAEALAAEIVGCACGRDHEVMPTDTYEDGTVVELVCRIHKRHEPCRKCLAARGFYDETGRVKKEFRDEVHRLP